MTQYSKYLDKSLTQLLEIIWTKDNVPAEDDSNVVREYYTVTLKKIKDFTNEDVRFCLSQETGLKFVVPIAIEILRDDILAEGDMYPGDIVTNLLRIDAEFWGLHTNLAIEVNNLCASGLEQIADDPELDGHTKKRLTRLIDRFLLQP